MKFPTDMLMGIIQNVMASTLQMYGIEGLALKLRPRQTADERIAKLEKVQSELEAAVIAVQELRSNASQAKQEATQLEDLVKQLRADKQAAEKLAELPQEAVARVIAKANAKSRGRGLVEGLAIGLVTGFLSSLLAWYLTKP